MCRCRCLHNSWVYRFRHSSRCRCLHNSWVYRFRHSSRCRCLHNSWVYRFRHMCRCRCLHNSWVYRFRHSSRCRCLHNSWVYRFRHMCRCMSLHTSRCRCLHRSWVYRFRHSSRHRCLHRNCSQNHRNSFNIFIFFPTVNITNRIITCPQPFRLKTYTVTFLLKKLETIILIILTIRCGHCPVIVIIVICNPVTRRYFGYCTRKILTLPLLIFCIIFAIIHIHNKSIQKSRKLVTYTSKSNYFWTFIIYDRIKLFCSIPPRMTIFNALYYIYFFICLVNILTVYI